MLAESGSESTCGRLKLHPQSEQCPVCSPLSLVLSSMVLSTSSAVGEGGSFFETSESDECMFVKVHSGVAEIIHVKQSDGLTLRT